MIPLICAYSYHAFLKIALTRNAVPTMIAIGNARQIRSETSPPIRPTRKPNNCHPARIAKIAAPTAHRTAPMFAPFSLNAEHADMNTMNNTALTMKLIILILSDFYFHAIGNLSIISFNVIMPCLLNRAVQPLESHACSWIPCLHDSNDADQNTSYHAYGKRTL